MAAPAENPATSETLEFVHTMTLEDRLIQNEGYVQEMNEETHLKAGFTITNLLSHLPLSRQVELDTESVIGWTFEFPAFYNNESNSADKSESASLPMEMLINNIVVRKIMVVRGDSGQIVVTKNVIDCEINPKIFGSKREMTPSGEIDYPSSFDLMKPFMLDDPGLHISRLEGYKNWAELAFISRTDLDLIRVLLEDIDSEYNQYFFTGAHADYLNLHNPEYVLRSENFTGKYTNQKIEPTTNRAFTLKAEPFVETIKANADKTAKMTAEMVRGDSNTSKTSIEGSPEAVSSIPLISLMTACPEIWYFEGDLDKSFLYAEPEMSKSARFEAVKIATNPQSGNISQDIPGSSFPSRPVPPVPYQPDFFDHLRDFFQAIVSLFTGGRNERNI